MKKDKLEEEKGMPYIDVLEIMTEEFERGAKAMLNHLRKNVSRCNGKDRCSICIEGERFLK